LLDKCLQQLDDGGDVEEVLATYPELADELRPALAASEWMRAFAPPPRRRLEQKQRFVAAVAERRRLVERVDGLVVEIKAGVPAAELSERLDASLRPVVAAAHRMHATDLPLPAAEAVEAGRQRLMAMAAERRRAHQPARAAAVGVRRGLLQGLLPRPSLARRVLTSAAAATLAATLALAGVVRVHSVAASSLPGEAFYGVKRLGENARMLFAFDPSRRADLEALFAQRRAQELVRLEAEGREVPIDFVEEWLTGHSASAAALADLTRDQRDALSRALRAVADDGDARARLEGSGVDTEVLDALLAPEPAPAPAADEPIGLHRGPSPRPQPMPEDDAAPAPVPARDPAPEAPPVVAEPVAPPHGVPPVGFVEAIPAAPAGDQAAGQGGDRGSSGGTGSGSGDPNPGAQPPSDPPAGVVEPPPAAAEPTDEPPPFVDPIAPGPQEPPDDPSGGTAP